MSVIFPHWEKIKISNYEKYGDVFIWKVIFVIIQRVIKFCHDLRKKNYLLS